jgi:hypothetical protein
MIHLRQEGQNSEDPRLMTLCGIEVPSAEAQWDAFEYCMDRIGKNLPRDTLCRECLDLEITRTLRDIHGLTIRLLAYREEFFGPLHRPKPTNMETPA